MVIDRYHSSTWGTAVPAPLLQQVPADTRTHYTADTLAPDLVPAGDSSAAAADTHRQGGWDDGIPALGNVIERNGHAIGDAWIVGSGVGSAARVVRSIPRLGVGGYPVRRSW